jgi:hypothetical protein
MKTGGSKKVRCAIYTRVSTDQGLEQDFNSLDAQYDASQAYIRSQQHAGWMLVRSKYDDGGLLRWQYRPPGAATSQIAGHSSETGKRRFVSDCVVGPGGLEVRRETGKE